MKIKSVIITVTIIACANVGLTARFHGPADEGETKREKADRIMCQTYGKNWLDIYTAAITNRAQSKAMTATYESAIGHHQAR